MPHLNNNYVDQITTLTSRIRSEFNLSIHLCGEIECYIQGAYDAMDAFWEALTDRFLEANIPLESIARERGENQYEFRLKPTAPLPAAEAIAALTRITIETAGQHYMTADFSALPANGQPGNGLHWHLHLANENGANVFLKRDNEMTEPLCATLGGLLFTMQALTAWFMPSEASYARLASGRDHVPTTVSWGGNNRSVALRMPESVVPVRHIEHRICGADADPFRSVWALLVGIDYGLRHQPDPGPQMFGNASDAKYALPLLPLTLEEAQAAFDSAEWLEGYRVNNMEIG